MKPVAPEQTFNEAKDLVGKVEANWKSVKLPKPLISAFSKAWVEYVGYPAIRSTGITRLHTSSERSENVADIDLALGIAVSPLRELLHRYKEYAIKAVNEADITEFKKEYGSKVQGTPACWKKLEPAIDALQEINAEEKALLKSFLTDSEKFYDIKGIARDDFATPALCKASGKRVDRFSIIDQIAGASNTTPEVYRLFVDFIEKIDQLEGNDDFTSCFVAICEFCRDYESHAGPIKTSDPESHKVLQNLETLLGELEKEFSKYRGVTFTFAHSKGSGSFPRVPWVGILPPGQSPKSGIYFSMCFGREGNGAVAGLAESVQNRGRIQTNERIEESKVINVNGGDPKQYYNNTYENPLEILKDSFSYEDLKEHVRVSLDRALECLDLKQSNPPMPFTKIPPEISDYTVCEALLSKPFTILTGASGTGKTKLATSLAKHLSNIDSSNSQIVAVGADWTDNRSVLGFVNHLNADKDGPRYQSTPILDLLLRATNDTDVPYFLILDEMNLSHVERYFADFLSAMEQKDGTLKLHSESSELRRAGRDSADVPAEIEYPENLFVIGTVNIDETTYMFSPKVLDRANVIEFTVSAGEIGAFLKEPNDYPEIETAAPGIAEGFLQLAKQARNLGCEKLPEQPAEKISKHLLDLFNILKAERFEFAYRTAKEINIYLQVCRHLAEDKAAWDISGWRNDLDDQILQKLLPKLHGSAGRIGKLLATLTHYCDSGEYKADISTQLSAAAELESGEKTAFPKSLAKLQSMIGTLRDEQFVSFIQ
ncbi:MAG: hypothetical protein ABF379_16905 [Akkermansiaceae bacterium]